MPKKDQEYIVKVEKAIAEKYGNETVQHPKSWWNDEKEEDYLIQIKEIYKKDIKKRESKERVEKDGFFVSKKLINRETKRNCPVCDAYSFSRKDDLYMNKFDCCFNCYVQWIEHREERWQDGWRPNLKEKDNGNNV